MSNLASLPNIGAKLAQKLESVGIATAEDLARIGSREAFMQIRGDLAAGARLSLLCALEGAIQGVRWRHLPEKDRAALRDFLARLTNDASPARNCP